MHRCLSCDQSCSITSVFCDACRASLLERRAEDGQLEMVKAGCREEMVDVVSLPRLEAVPVGSPVEQRSATPLAGVESEHSRVLETTGVHTVEVVDGMDEQNGKAGVAQATNMLAVSLPARRVMPRRVRRALLVFCIVGVLALFTDGVLLALSIARHHAPQVMHYDQSGVISPQLVPTPTPRRVSSPVLTRPVAVGTFWLSSSRLTFAATEGQTALAPQTVTLSTGDSAAFSWQVAPDSTLPSWLQLSTLQGRVASGGTADLVVSAQTAQLEPGSYTASILIKAFNSRGKELANSPGTLLVALGVRPPCILTMNPAKFSFAAVLLSAPAPQQLTLTESPDCAFPVYWQISSDAAWVTFSSATGADAGTGTSINVQASSANKLIGSYTAHITLQAVDSSGVPVTVSPSVITVTLTVLG